MDKCIHSVSFWYGLVYSTCHRKCKKWWCLIRTCCSFISFFSPELCVISGFRKMSGENKNIFYMFVLICLIVYFIVIIIIIVILKVTVIIIIIMIIVIIIINIYYNSLLEMREYCFRLLWTVFWCLEMPPKETCPLSCKFFCLMRLRNSHCLLPFSRFSQEIFCSFNPFAAEPTLFSTLNSLIFVEIWMWVDY